MSDEVRDALGDDYPIVSLGERQLPGIVAPFPVWRLDTTPELEDDLPLSFVE